MSHPPQTNRQRTSSCNSRARATSALPINSRARASSALPRFQKPTAQRLISALVAFALLISMCFSVSPLQATGKETGTTPASASTSTLNVLVHFKDSDGATVDFAQTTLPLSEETDYISASIDPSSPLPFSEEGTYEIYEHFASFNNKQRALTSECTYDAATRELRFPRTAVESSETNESLTAEDVENTKTSGNTKNTETTSALTVVFELPVTHPAYEELVLAHLRTESVTLPTSSGRVSFVSEIPSLLQEEGLSRTEITALTGLGTHTSLSSASLTNARKATIETQASGFPGTASTRYRVNNKTRLEGFDVDMPRKQAAYGFPAALLGSYGFGVFFGSEQTWVNGTSQGTTFNKPVLDTTSNTYDAAVETFFSDTLAAGLGSKARFATSRTDANYRDAYITTGKTYQDTNYSEGQAPNNKAMAHATCGSANVNNGRGATRIDPTGENYLTYKGVYSEKGSPYDGWYKFFYRIEAKSAQTNAEFQDLVGYVLIDPIETANVQLTKTSSEPAINNDNAQYSLENALYAAFTTKDAAQSASTKAAANTWNSFGAARTWAQTNAAYIFTTTKAGTSNLITDANPGTYYVCELFAPRGFRLNTTISKVEFATSHTAQDITHIKVQDVPQQGAIDLVKTSNVPELTTNNRNYALTGAVYSVYRDKAASNLYTTLSPSLNSEGNLYGKITGVPLGTYWVKETSLPQQGFALDPTLYQVTVTDGATTRVNGTSVSDKAKLEPLNVFIEKKDRASKKSIPQGAGSLGDAQYKINYYAEKNATLEDLKSLEPLTSWIVRTNDNGQFLLSEGEGVFDHVVNTQETITLPYRVSGPSFYKLSDGRLAMPLGTYTIQEVKAPQGYFLDPTIHLRHINDDGNTTESVTSYQAEEGDDMISDRVARSDVRFLKRADGSSKLAGIPFKLTSVTTGEWHIIVSDKNGQVSTEATIAHPHSASTNANDAQFKTEDGSFSMPLVVDMSALDATAGVWFGTPSEAPVNDSLGALPFDTYVLEELPCPANEAYRMITDEILVDKTDDGSTIDLGTLNNTTSNKPSLRTNAYDGTSDNPYKNEIMGDSAALVIDRVSYSGLTPGETYEIRGRIYSQETGKPHLADGKLIESLVTFEAVSSNGYINVPFSFDGSTIEKTTKLVVFETLYHNGTELATHHDLNDAHQTVTVTPYSIKTSAVDAETGTKEGVPAEKVTIIDTVTFTNLIPGSEYKLIACPILKVNGERVGLGNEFSSTEKTFTPETANGTVDVEITIPGSDLDGKQVVIFETLMHNDEEIALHADISDENQTVSYAASTGAASPFGEEETESAEEPSEEESSDEASSGKSSSKKSAVAKAFARTGDNPLVLAGISLLALASGLATLLVGRKLRG